MPTEYPTPEAPWLLLAATSAESEPFVRHGMPVVLPASRATPLVMHDRDPSDGTMVGRGSLLIACPGIGRDGDQAVARILRRIRPAAAINVGVAGALAPGLCAGDVLVVDGWVDRDGTGAVLRTADAGLGAALERALAAAETPVRHGLALTVDEPLHDRRARDAVHARTGAAIVEMEGMAWAGAAATAGAPFAGLRVVSDRADRHLPLLRHELMSSHGRVHWPRWLAALTAGDGWRRPFRELRRLRAARHDWRVAMETLDHVAAALAGQRS